MSNVHFMPIPPRHRRALEMLLVQRHHDAFGGIGIGAMRDDDEPFTLEQIVEPLMVRGLIEDLTWTDLREDGKYFVRLTKLGEFCLGVGYMLREPRLTSEAEMRKYAAELPPPSSNPYDPNDEKEAIA